MWRWREKLISWAAQLKIPSRLPPEAAYLRWLVVFNVIAIVMVTILAYWIDLRFVEWTLRIAAALAVAAQASTLVLLAPRIRASGLAKSGVRHPGPGRSFLWLVLAGSRDLGHMVEPRCDSDGRDVRNRRPVRARTRQSFGA